jgi:hypothetical protein
MLINCPRCGFSQPKDQYCAQCGVDMLSYKPKSPPMAKTILQSGLFQVVLLIVVAVFVGQYIIRSDEPQKWVQKITRSQGVVKLNTKNLSATKLDSSSQKPTQPGNELQALRNQEIAIPVASEKSLLGAGSSEAVSSNSASTMAAATGKNLDATAETTTPTFRLIYAEVNRENLAKWVNDSAGAGLYQNLQEYSAGILTDFRKRSDITLNQLLTTDKRMALGQSETTLSGSVSDDANAQMIGLSTAIEYRTNENGVLHGSIVVSRNNRQTRETFPAEFDLPRGAVFFLIGALKNTHFLNEKSRLTMAPFQILRSPDFMTQKTEFVIILEPEYK